MSAVSIVGIVYGVGFVIAYGCAFDGLRQDNDLQTRHKARWFGAFVFGVCSWFFLGIYAGLKFAEHRSLPVFAQETVSPIKP